MALDQFVVANSGLPAGRSKDDYEWAYFSARSGLTPAKDYALTSHKIAYYQSQAPTSLKHVDDVQKAWKDSTRPTRTNRIGNPRGIVGQDGSELRGGGQNVNFSSDTNTAGGFGTSFRMAPNNPGNGDSYLVFGDSGSIRNGMIAGQTYTVSGTIILPGAQVNPGGSARPRRIVLFTNTGSGYTETPSSPAPNTAGTTRLSLTFTLPSNVTEAFIRFYNGSDTLADVCYWTGLMLEQSAVLGDFFDGAMPSCSWQGTPNASLSTGTPGPGR